VPDYLDIAVSGAFQSNYLNSERLSSIPLDEEQGTSWISYAKSDDLSKHQQLFGSLHLCRDFKFISLQYFSSGLLICLAWSLICLIGYTISATFTIY